MHQLLGVCAWYVRERAADSSEERAPILYENSELRIEATRDMKTQLGAEAVDQNVVLVCARFKRVGKSNGLAIVDESNL